MVEARRKGMTDTEEYLYMIILRDTLLARKLWTRNRNRSAFKPVLQVRYVIEYCVRIL